MSIKMGIYDFFAYTLPGILYILTAAYLLKIFSVTCVALEITDFSISYVLAVAILSYMAGIILDPFSVLLWHRFFSPKELNEIVLKNFIKRYHRVEFIFNSTDWPILLSYIRKENMDIVADIEKFNAVHIMLRNISFSFVLLSIVILIKVILIRPITSPFYFISMIIILLAFSITTAKRSAKYKEWFFSSIFEAILARTLNIDDFATKKNI